MTAHRGWLRWAHDAHGIPEYRMSKARSAPGQETEACVVLHTGDLADVLRLALGLQGGNSLRIETLYDQPDAQ